MSCSGKVGVVFEGVVGVTFECYLVHVHGQLVYLSYNYVL
jgi:hypothetical protein